MSSSSVLTVSDAALDQIIRRVVEAYHPERIWLFGSVARGEAGPDSDYDLMVVMPDDASPEMLRSRVGYRASRGVGVARDVLVMRNSDFTGQLNLRASLPSTVVREGRLMYQRG